jgi:hypothetical protein
MIKQDSLLASGIAGLGLSPCGGRFFGAVVDTELELISLF